ncbi:hypothetical protein KY289_015038 [Solanum tuberosum]|nr:hypothetical protein KY289_015038 [Solanum tuberosum]
MVMDDYGLSEGEAVSSNSNLSLLEIVTKTHEMPNDYQKVLKIKRTSKLVDIACSLRVEYNMDALAFSNIEWKERKLHWIRILYILGWSGNEVE